MGQALGVRLSTRDLRPELYDPARFGRGRQSPIAGRRRCVYRIRRYSIRKTGIVGCEFSGFCVLDRLIGRGDLRGAKERDGEEETPFGQGFATDRRSFGGADRGRGVR
jgi:hypothetical protein